MYSLLYQILNRKIYFSILLLSIINFALLKAQNFESYPKRFLAEEESKKSVTLIFEPRQTKNNQYLVDVKVKDFTAIKALQFTFEWDALKMHYSDIPSTNKNLSLNEDNFYNSNAGTTEFNWTSPNGVTLANNEIIFKVLLYGNPRLQDTLIKISGFPLEISCQNDLGEELGINVEYHGINAISRVPTPVGQELFPNPSEGIFYDEWLNPGIKIDVLDSFGNTIKSDLTANDGMIDLLDVDSGTYFLRIKKEDFHIVEKVVILK
ncbi:MAG: T9SS type A sorting domain-containing protein [Ignavibacteriae bacterium]|nr:T9SS type A sorting domain-containing protein [Ignavibacteriota bacterium]